MDELKRFRVCLAVAALVLGWTVFAFGSYGDEYRAVAGWGTAIGGAICLALLPASRRFPSVPLPLGISMALLLCFGWLMVVNARSEHSLVVWQFTPLDHLSWLPGSVARSTSLRALLELTAVLIAFLAVVRSTESPAWRSLVGLIVLLGLFAALVGFLHKATRAETVWWVSEGHPATLFAPFLYHANAGAFMNLCLPLAVGLALSRPGDERARSAGILWGVVAVVIAAGVAASSSKGALAILAMTLVAVFAWNWSRFQTIGRLFFLERGRRTERVVLLVVLVGLALGFSVLGIGLVGERLQSFFARVGESGTEDLTGREDIIALLLEMSAPSEGGWHGFGPGTFQHVLPYFNLEEKVSVGRWYHGHSDPLQTMVEWGWLGAAGWFTIGGGAVVAAILLLRRRWVGTDEVPILRGLVIGLVFLGVHSAVDFPLSNFAIHLTAMLLCAVCWGLFATRRREARELAAAGSAP